MASQRVLAVPVAGRARVAQGRAERVAGLATIGARSPRGARRARVARSCHLAGPSYKRRLRPILCGNEPVVCAMDNIASMAWG